MREQTLLETLDLAQGRGKQWGRMVRQSRITAAPEDFARLASATGSAGPNEDLKQG